MSGAENLNILWAEALVDELARCGVRRAAVAPGSRSAPLALALHRHASIAVTVHCDERSAAYYALGSARASGIPATVLTTSGTAVANLLPAAVEAWQAGVPLVLLTADRPRELRDVGANQAIRQAGLFGHHTVFDADLGEPWPAGDALRHLRQTVCRAVAQARAGPGPVHINQGLRDPLDLRQGDEETLKALAASDPEAVSGRLDGAPWLRIDRPVLAPDAAAVADLARRVSVGPGVLVAGPARPGEGPVGEAVLRLARLLDCPVLADPLSGVRHGPHGGAAVLTAYDAFLASPEVRHALRPAWTLRVGATATSRNVHHWQRAHPDAAHAVVDGMGRAWDDTWSAYRVLQGDPNRVLEALIEAVQGPGTGPGAWTKQWRAVESAAQDACAALEGPDWEGPMAAACLRSLPEGGLLWVGSSLPVRDLDRFGAAQPHPVQVLANRGASGIDGVLSSAAGAAAAHDGPSLALVGDLTFQHDVGALEAIARHAPRLTVVVVRNGGGQVFRHLPLAEHSGDAFESLFVAPPAVDVLKACAAFGVAHERLEGSAGLASALESRLGRGGVIEVVVDGRRSAQRRQEAGARAAAAAAAALAG